MVTFDNQNFEEKISAVHKVKENPRLVIDVKFSAVQILGEESLF